jgi:hypothetical protein
VSNITRITDYDSVTLDLLITQYRDSDNLKGVIRALNEQAEDIEQALFEIRDEFWLFPVAGSPIVQAVGKQLDVLGAVFGEPRNGRSDALYREAIRIASSLQYSGEPEAIISILKTVFGASYAHYTPGWPTIPATYYIVTDVTISRWSIDVISPAGVLGILAAYLMSGDGRYIVDGRGRRIIASTGV